MSAGLFLVADNAPLKPTVEYFSRQVYGLYRMYPANETARWFLQLTHKDTFSAADLEVIRRLGFAVREGRDPKAPAEGRP